MLAPVREWKMGREEEIAYAREHGIPIKGANEAAAPYSIDDNLWGRSSEGRSIEDLAEPHPRRRLHSSSPGPSSRPTSPSWSGSGSRPAGRSRSTASASDWSS